MQEGALESRKAKTVHTSKFLSSSKQVVEKRLKRTNCFQATKEYDDCPISHNDGAWQDELTDNFVVKRFPYSD